MSTNDDFDRLLGSWLSSEASAQEPPDFHRGVIGLVRGSRQRPRWLVVARGSIGVPLPAVRPQPRRWSAMLLLAALIALLAASVAIVGSRLLPSPSPYQDIFRLTGSLAEPRMWHTATLLADGRVLVTGGQTGGDGTELATAAVWDPATGLFSPTGSMLHARSAAAAVQLSDGRVLIVGGASWANGTIAEAEVWDPATGAFSQAGSLAEARRSPTATLLADGRVLVVGGSLDWLGNVTAATAEIWDPTTMTFRSAGSLAAARDGHTTTLLQDGRVLVVGGTAQVPHGDGTVSAFIATAEVWDPAAMTFSPAGSLGATRMGHAATLLTDGRVLVVGGGDCCFTIGTLGDGSDSAEIWDPGTMTFSPAGTLIHGRSGHTATLMPDGQVLVVGGYDATGYVGDTAELWDPARMTFSPAASLSEARIRQTATLLGDGRVLVIGGEGNAPSGTGSAQVLASAELFGPP